MKDSEGATGGNPEKQAFSTSKRSELQVQHALRLFMPSEIANSLKFAMTGYIAGPTGESFVIFLLHFERVVG